ncbi:MAG: YaaA family protein [Spirochaetota bacterium]
MIALLSPTKTLDWTTPAPVAPRQAPRFLSESAPVAERLRELNGEQLSELFGVKEKTAAVAYHRMQNWSTSGHEQDGARPALYAFSGPVYRAMDPWSFDTTELEYAQSSFLILSGLYGILSPLDGILPYRLDMGAALPSPDGGKLSDYWKDRVTDAVERAAEQTGSQAVLNLASKEYVSAVAAENLSVPLVECRFEELKGGEYRQVRNQIKRARGLMASHLARSGARTLDDARKFRLEGYRYHPERSDERTLVFARDTES